MEALLKSDYYYDLPQELIAQDPLEDRSSSRLMFLNKKTGELSHHSFKDVIEFLNPGDCLVLNNTKVIPARLIGHKEETGGTVEVLLLKRKENDQWETLVKPGKKARPGAKIVFGDGLLKAEVLDVLEEGNRLIQFTYDGIFEEVLDKLGEMPLPPYITHKLQDKNRYQTVYRSDGGTAFYSGASFTNREKGHPVSLCYPACRSWYFPPGQGRKSDESPHAFGVLSGDKRGCGYHQSDQRSRWTGDLCRHYKLPDNRERSRGRWKSSSRK